MANPAKQKGTGGETELVGELNGRFGPDTFRRSWANAAYDLYRVATEFPHLQPVEALATRPDRGRWLVTVDLHDFMDLIEGHKLPVHIEVKRYARFALHTIFEQKFPRRP